MSVPYPYFNPLGSKIHASMRNDKYGEPFSKGDVIGCYIRLDSETPDANEMRFFKNGIDQGVAFKGKEISPGVFFPAVSTYMKVLSVSDTKRTVYLYVIQ